MTKQGWDVVDEATEPKKDIEWLKFPEGVTTIRVLEPPIRKVRHWIQSQMNNFDCIGADCPVCAINREEYQNTGKNKYSKADRFFMQVIVRDESRGDYLAIMDASKTLATDIRMLQAEVGDVSTFDIKVVRKGTKKDTTWNVIPQQISEMSEHDEELKKEMIDVKTLWEAPTREQWLMILDGVDPQEVFKTKISDSEVEEDEEVDFTVE